MNLKAKPGAGSWRRQSLDRKSTRLNSSHLGISYAVFCLTKKNRYFARPAVAIKQIASYGFRARNGNSWGAPSEPAFGNALDIGVFSLAGADDITLVEDM